MSIGCSGCTLEHSCSSLCISAGDKHNHKAMSITSVFNIYLEHSHSPYPVWLGTITAPNVLSLRETIELLSLWMFPRDLVHSVEVAFKLLDYFHPIFSKFSSIVPALSGTMEILFTIRRCRLPMYDSLEVHRSRRSRIVLVGLGHWDFECRKTQGYIQRGVV